MAEAAGAAAGAEKAEAVATVVRMGWAEDLTMAVGVAALAALDWVAGWAAAQGADWEMAAEAA